METLIVLAMHGVPPNDFPGRQLGEYFRLHAAVEAAHHGRKHGGGHNGHSQPSLSAQDTNRYQELETRIRNWPRTEANDPFHAGSLSLAKSLQTECGLRVLIGFNEFCAPSLEETFHEASKATPERVIVVTPMMTSGGSHAEEDIPSAIQAAREKYPAIEFIYAWPFEHDEVARFLAVQVGRHLTRMPEPQSQ